MPNNPENKIRPSFDDTESNFDRVLTPQPTSLRLLPTRLELKGKEIPLNNKSEYAIHLYKVIVSALQSEWFQSLVDITQLGYKNSLLKFIPWLNTHNINHENRYTILKDFEAYRVNEKRVKPQSTGLRDLLSILSNGVHSNHIKNETLQFIHTLLTNTTFSIADEHEAQTLSSYFASMPWLREVLGENDYLKLESPKRLMRSFSIVVATTLLFILQAKKEARKQLERLDVENLTLKGFKEKRDRNLHYCRNLLIKLGGLNEDGQPNDALTELIILDCVPKDRREKLLVQWYKSIENSKFSFREPSQRLLFFTSPLIFAPESWACPSAVEQYLCAWLCAWQTVQPTDISKLKLQDFVITKNEHGRPVALQCLYYKGRSQRMQEPPMLDANQIEAQALLAYLEQLPPEKNLFTSNIHNSPNIGFGSTSITERFARLFRSPIIQSQINEALNKQQSSPLFLRAFIAISDPKESNNSRWYKTQKKRGLITTIDAYRETIARPLPQLLFGLRAIKNSAVHARTDLYRDGDLVNQNSHSSQTERAHYTNDANKDWVNQKGRITRLVLHDIERFVYRPNLTAAHQEAHDLVLRTKVIQVAGNSDADSSTVKINPLGRVNDPSVDLEEFGAKQKIAAPVLGITVEVCIRWRVALAHTRFDRITRVVIGIIA